jgi:hypothetical protein
MLVGLGLVAKKLNRKNGKKHLETNPQELFKRGL